MFKNFGGGYGPFAPLAMPMSATTQFAQWNLVLAHFQQSKFYTAYMCPDKKTNAEVFNLVN